MHFYSDREKAILGGKLFVLNNSKKMFHFSVKSSISSYTFYISCCKYIYFFRMTFNFYRSGILRPIPFYPWVVARHTALHVCSHWGLPFSPVGMKFIRHWQPQSGSKRFFWSGIGFLLKTKRKKKTNPLKVLLTLQGLVYWLVQWTVGISKGGGECCACC